MTWPDPPDTTRRTWVTAMGTLAAIGGAPFIASAQTPPRTMRLGWLRPNPQAATEFQDQGVQRALLQRGWQSGVNLLLERRWADGRTERLPQLAKELVDARCDAILAVGASAVAAAMQATAAIPVVMFGNFDPVARGFVASLGRPGGHVTGVLIAPNGTLAAKKVELLSELVPRLRRIGFLAPDDPAIDSQIVESRTAATSRGFELSVATTRPGSHDRAFGTLAAAGAQAVIVGAHTFFMFDRHKLIELTLRHRLPSIWEWSEQVRDGGLMSYGASLTERYDRVAAMVDRLFKGARPSEIPVEQPAGIGLSINLRTARSIGLEVPRTLLVRADEVID